MLMCLYCLHKVCSIYQTLMCTGIQPCESLSEKFYIQIAFLQINTVQVGNLQLSSGTWLQVLRILYDLIIIEVQPRYTIIALRMLWLLFNRNGLAILIKLYDTESLRIIYIVSKYGSTLTRLCILHCCCQTFLHTVSCENIISQYHRNGIITNEFLSNDECLSQSIRAWLYCIRQLHSKLMSVSQQFFESRCILWCRNN